MTKNFKTISFICFLFATVILSFICIPLVKGFADVQAIDSFKQNFGGFSVFALLLIQILQIIVALIPGEVIEFVSGALFGPLWGTLLCLAGILAGQYLVFILVSKWGNGVISPDKKMLQKFTFLKDIRKVKILTFILFFLPGTPKDLLTYFIPATNIDLKSFLSISVIARIPSVLSSTIAGTMYAKGNIKLTLFIYAVVAITSGIGYIVYKFFFDRRHKNGTNR